MAILGLQVVFSLVMFTFLHKLAPYYSVGRWILAKRLYRYLHPSNEELKQLSLGTQTGKPTNQTSKAKRRAEHRRNAANASADKTEPFSIPRNLPVQLDQAQVEAIDLLPLQYYSEYTWLMDFSISTIVVYVLTEIYFILTPHRLELNLSILWCLLATVFCLRVLASLAWVYLRTQEGGERTLLVTFTFFFLVFAMGALIVGDEVIEFGLEEGYQNFSKNAVEFLKKQEISSHGPVSYFAFKSTLVLVSVLLSALLIFPGLRLAKLHLDTLKYNEERRVVQFLLQVNYLLPLVLIVLWVKPVGRGLLCGRNFNQVQPVFYNDQFDGFRLLLVLVMCGIRLALMPLFMQSHLNLAHEKIESIKKESGRITNTELQKTVARVFYYLCVVAVQYVAPVLVILFLTFLLKTLGGFSWVGLFGETAVDFFTSTAKPAMKMPKLGEDNSTIETIIESAAHITNTIGDIRNIFSPVWYRGLLSYFLWWVITVWFSSTSLGIMYYSQSL